MKNIILYLLKWIGFFKFSKYLVRNQLVILAYHGVEIYNESSFSPNLFIKRSTLEKRMAYLNKNGFNVISLDEALTKLDTTQLPQNSVVITVDDGWYSTLAQADQVFSKYSFPYTIYMTSYYAQKKLPVLNVVIRYLLWSCTKQTITLKIENATDLNETYTLSDTSEKVKLQQKLIEHLNALKTTQQKKKFIEAISTLLGVDYKKIESERYFGLLSDDEIIRLSDRGVDIQLHTHRHTMPADKNKLENEINANKSFLEPCVKSQLAHLCYPSGQYHLNMEPVLKDMDIRSATTCFPGFINPNTNPYFLPRFLDGENIPQVIFEAEVCGVLELFRKIRKLTHFFRG